MTLLKNLTWVEKYRPKNFDELIFQNKESLKVYIKDKESIPSLLFYSSSPGTGKTSTALIIANELGCDFRKINASDERGIDVIRDSVKNFAQAMSSVFDTKRCILLDEADGLTKQAQESMKSLMETFSSNCFFIFSCNDVSKIIEPIRKGRTLCIDFSKPPKDSILERLKYICREEKLKFSDEELKKLIENNYPDIRSMILALQVAKVENKTTLVNYIEYQDFMKAMKEKNVQYIYEKVYSGFDIKGFVRYYFEKLFQLSDSYAFKRLSRVATRLAEIEKASALGINLEIVFISNILEIMKGSSNE